MLIVDIILYDFLYTFYSFLRRLKIHSIFRDMASQRLGSNCDCYGLTFHRGLL